jgi:hypothetical protein
MEVDKEVKDLWLCGPNPDPAPNNVVFFHPSQIKMVGIKGWGGGEQDNCPVCRLSLHDPCIKCRSQDIVSSTEVWETCKWCLGGCGHMYHFHCISEWINRRLEEKDKTCPMCVAPWVIEKME